jgi:hypothetical protein
MRVQKKAADQAAAQSKIHVRRVKAREPEVQRMVGLLAHYSERNGFADAFQQMITERGQHGGGASGG